MTHPYFVSIKELIFPEKSQVIIDPNADELQREFGEADHLMIPFQSVHLIEEHINAGQSTKTDTGKVIQFSGKEQNEDE